MAMASPKQSNNDSFQGGFALDLSQGEEAWYGQLRYGTDRRDHAGFHQRLHQRMMTWPRHQSSTPRKIKDRRADGIVPSKFHHGLSEPFAFSVLVKTRVVPNEQTNFAVDATCLRAQSARCCGWLGSRVAGEEE